MDHSDKKSSPGAVVPLKGSERRPSPTAKLLGPADEQERFTVTIVLRRRSDVAPPPDFEHFGKPPKEMPGRYTPGEFAEKFGADPSEVAQVVHFAEASGLQVLDTHISRRTVIVAGTVSQMSSAFSVSLGRYEHTIVRHHGRRPHHIKEIYRGRDGIIHVPAHLAEIITGVFGLDNRTITKKNSADPPGTGYMTAGQVAGLYQFPTSTAVGQSIGIMSPTGSYGGYFSTDLHACMGSALPAVTDIQINGSGNGSKAMATTADVPAGNDVLSFASTSGILVQSSLQGPALSGRNPGAGFWVTAITETEVTLSQPLANDLPAGSMIYFNPDGETTQDICIASLAAPGAAISVFFSTGDQNGWLSLLQRAVHPAEGDPVCSVLSSSFYISNGDDAATLLSAGVSAAMINALSSAFHDAAIQHVTVCIASGDSGSNSKTGRYPAPDSAPLTYTGDGKAHVQYPASDPWILSVGGTTIGGLTNGSATFDEYVWNDPDPSDPTQWGTTGGGISDFFDLPSYQAPAGVPVSVNDGSRTGRGVPDVAGNASYNSGYSGLFLAGQPDIGNGTSASAPHWAGLIALINAALGHPAGFINSYIYQSGGAAAFRDISPPPDGSGGPLNNGNSGISGYPATTGWDACTGWGSPNGRALLTFLQNQQQVVINTGTQ